MAKVIAEDIGVNLPKETTSMIPGCNREGINYSSECQTCRKIGVRKQYPRGVFYVSLSVR